MATPPKIATLRETDLALPSGTVTGADVQEAFRRLFSQLNPYLDSLNKLASKGITFADNVQCDLVTGTFSHGQPQSVRLKTLARASGVLVLGCDGQRSAGTAIQMQQSSTNDRSALVTIYFANTSAVNVECTLVLLPEGQQSNTIPA